MHSKNDNQGGFMFSRFAMFLLCSVVALFPILRAGEGHAHGDEAAGPNGGEIQKVGDKADSHVEVKHDHTGGKTTLTILAKDLKTPVAVKDAPVINIRTKDGNKQIKMTPVNPVDGAASQWEAADDAFKTDPLDGRIVITLEGEKFQVKLDPHFGLDHDKGHEGHEGHNH